jgi:predicted transposase YbfD/YdcC
VLGQLKTEEKSSEITAIAELLRALAIKQEKIAKLGVKNKRLKARWDDSYHVKLLLRI